MRDLQRLSYEFLRKNDEAWFPFYWKSALNGSMEKRQKYLSRQGLKISCYFLVCVLCNLVQEVPL
jgi:hypothetical protein